MINNHETVRGHRELKKQLRTDSNRRKRDECNSKLAKKHPPKKPCTAYVTFSKEMWKTVAKDNPSCSMREVNSKISELWNQGPGDICSKCKLMEFRYSGNIDNCKNQYNVV